MSRPRARSRVDRALAFGGVACACASLAFACVMTLRKDKIPLVFGEEYLGIFARPNTQPARDSLALNGDSHAIAPPGVDFTPTGSIPNAGEADAPPAAEGGPTFISVFRGGAWMQSGRDFVLVRPGDVVPTLGRIGAIQRVQGRWMVVLADGSAVAASAPSAANGRFDRSLIFGR